MEVIIKNNQEQACKLGAKIVARFMRKKTKMVLGLATGSTPLPIYKELIRMHREEGLSFSQTVTFNLDEYVGLPPGHPGSYRTYMEDNLFRHVDIATCATHLPNGNADDIPTACAEYERSIQTAGGIDLQILGLGGDGHLAFNEPSSSLRSRTRLKTLTTETRKANAAVFGKAEKVPMHVITMGLETIMAARCCLLFAFGRGKADATQKMIEGPVSASCPASILQFHEQAVVIIDEDAASQLINHEYYREVYSEKPDWQKWE
ncbi:MAG: glucosamine-6-phosphate deaminase [Candidatus Riflebacteria bacterium]|nr:glucosamine-6-phosphate deaminase [Candidatus Riflebacteria bacterium]